MARNTLRKLASIAAARKQTHGVEFVFLAFATLTGKASNPSWVLSFGMSDSGVASTVVEYTLADDSGKIKKFGTIDAAVKAVAFVNEDNGGNYTVDTITGQVYAEKVPANLYTDAENKIVRLNKIATAQSAKVAALNALMATGGAMFEWNLGNTAQQARYAETVAQRDAIQGDIAAIGEEVDALQEVVESNPDYIAP